MNKAGSKVTDALERFDALGAKDQDITREFVEAGGLWRQQLLEVMHGERDPRAVDPRAVNAWRSDARTFEIALTGKLKRL